MLQRYSGVLGEFCYDDSLWHINAYGPELRWIGGNRECNLPKGVISCKGMFKGCKFSKAFMFGDFDTSEVIDMSSMFLRCTLPEDFTLGEKFLLSCVQSTEDMFKGCVMSDDIQLPTNLTYRDLVNANGMFSGCHMPKGYKLVLHSGCQTEAMFENCVMPEGFKLVMSDGPFKPEDALLMFYNCKFASDFVVLNKWFINCYDKMQGVIRDAVIYDEGIKRYIELDSYLKAIVCASSDANIEAE